MNPDAHVLVDCYPVEKQTFGGTFIDYYVAEVSTVGLEYTGNHEDPRGIVAHGETEKEAQADVRSQLKDCKFSKKQIEFKRVKL